MKRFRNWLSDIFYRLSTWLFVPDTSAVQDHLCDESCEEALRKIPYKTIEEIQEMVANELRSKK